MIITHTQLDANPFCCLVKPMPLVDYSCFETVTVLCVPSGGAVALLLRNTHFILVPCRIRTQQCYFIYSLSSTASLFCRQHQKNPKTDVKWRLVTLVFKQIQCRLKVDGQQIRQLDIDNHDHGSVWPKANQTKHPSRARAAWSGLTPVILAWIKTIHNKRTIADISCITVGECLGDLIKVQD